ncbi:MAG: coproporphyrinogen dehydrogenase HemZ [Eubacterium sp.]|nr:coproporphyrinogen dehydrogenase HemZ [Eubacterium sp.]
MKKIFLEFSEKNFEYDVYNLIKAFYPESEPEIHYSGEAETDEIQSWMDYRRARKALTDPSEADASASAMTNQAKAEALRALDGDFAEKHAEVLKVRKESPDFDAAVKVNYRQRAASFTFEDFAAGKSFSRAALIPDWSDRHDAKNRVKQLTYKALAAYTERELPWGDLTGIRPTKLAMHALEEGSTPEEAERFMQETYLTSPEKAHLAADVACLEKKIMDGMDPLSGYSLYVDVPYCPSICLYCTFGSHEMNAFRRTVTPYLDALEKELDFIKAAMQGRRLDTIYVGGGTPTSLEAADLDRLLSMICSRFGAEKVREFTVESGRPDTITGEKLDVLKKYPVSRISINPQTMNQKTLDIIGRKHTVDQVRSTFRLAREKGFSNINMDLIVGLPGEGEKEVAATLKEIEALHPDSLTIHSLALKRAARLSLFKDRYVPVSFENSAAIMDRTAASARAMGMHPYYLYRQKSMAGNFENVGYAKPCREGLYNILIMEEKQTILAAGSGASTKFVFEGGKRIERVENVKNVSEYISRIDEMIERKREGIRKYLPAAE